ncbi:MAG: HEAT repeat domain-containing protein [Deltaproteobacteria bacterium]|nr:HEAT repeat domain-containing protein [Deltaproteobacteria bacterium]
MSGALSGPERDALLDGLASSSEEVRRLAVEQLLRLPGDEAVPLLVERLGDEAWRVRKAAIERLIVCRDDGLVLPGLISALADGENPGRRNAASEALVALSARAIDALVAAAASSDADVRKLAIDTLAAIGDGECRAVFVRALADGDVNVRAAAADALGGVGGVGEIGELLRVGTSASEAPLVRLSALRSLERLGASVSVDRLSDALAHPQLLPAALELLGHSTDPAAPPQLEKALSSGVRSVRESAIGAVLRQLARLDGAEAERLCERLRTVAHADPALALRCCEGLTGEDGARRIALIQLLGIIADERSVLPLLEAGRDEASRDLVDSTLCALGDVTVEALRHGWDALEVDLEMRACGVLGRIGGEAAEMLLVSALMGERAACVGRAALALGDGAYYRRMPDLVRRLDRAAAEEDGESRELVEELIASVVRLAERAESADPAIHFQLVDVLISRLGGATPALRVAIARVLARIGGPQDVDVIEYLAKDASPPVRRAAVEALARLDGERTWTAVRRALGDESSGVRIAAAGALAASASPTAFEDLERLAGDGDPRVAAAAVRAAGDVYARSGTVPGAGESWLARPLAREPIVALAVLEVLGRLGGTSAAALAATALERPEPDVVRAAASCLARHGATDDLTRLVALIAHADWSVRAGAVEALTARRFRRALPAMLRRLDVEEDAYVRDALLEAARRLEE